MAEVCYREAPDLVGKILSRVSKTLSPDTCWTWMGGKSREGYGLVNRGPGLTHGLVHRLVYAQLVGPIPVGLQLDHLCRNRSCCNPNHLEPVTARENTLRGLGPAAMNAQKTHCPQGHAYEGENLQIRPDGSRRCRQCGREFRLAANRRRGVQPKHRSACGRGHEFTEANTRTRADGKRACRQCEADYARARRTAAKAKSDVVEA